MTYNPSLVGRKKNFTDIVLRIIYKAERQAINAIAKMYELHKNEQYFFDSFTISHLVSFLSKYNEIGLLCAPMLGKALANSGKQITVLDIDDRFMDVPGFLHWDIYRPTELPQSFEIIVCDPPFFNISLSQLFKAIRVLAHYDFEQKILVSYLARRQHAIMNTFSPFKLEPTGFYPTYVTVQKIEKNIIEFFGNLNQEEQTLLK